jgi:hypothetical protein
MGQIHAQAIHHLTSATGTSPGPGEEVANGVGAAADRIHDGNVFPFCARGAAEIDLTASL